MDPVEGEKEEDQRQREGSHVFDRGLHMDQYIASEKV